VTESRSKWRAAALLSVAAEELLASETEGSESELRAVCALVRGLGLTDSERADLENFLDSALSGWWGRECGYGRPYRPTADEAERYWARVEKMTPRVPGQAVSTGGRADRLPTVHRE